MVQPFGLTGATFVCFPRTTSRAIGCGILIHAIFSIDLIEPVIQKFIPQVYRAEIIRKANCEIEYCT